MPEKDKLVPAVPAQEAPRCNLAEIPGHDCAVDACEPSEPQAGAQVPSQDADAELLANDIMKIVTRGWEPQGKIPVANYNRIFAEVYTLLLRVAQVPSQDEIGSILVAAIDRHITDESLRDLAVIAANGIYWRNQRIGELETHLNTIKSYATEAAKTPITREDMHDPLKAQTFYDEAKGFERLVLSEIGGAK